MLQNRWVALAVLFLVRATMGVQFQAVPALGPMIMQEYGLDLAQLGLLVALYMSPGIVIAYPGGAFGAWIGDRRAVALGLVLMIAGAAIMTWLPVWSGQVAGRLIAGIGAITLNVLMTKLVADQFAGREISTAMAIFVNSWPLGIAFSLVVLPAIGAGAGLPAAMNFVLWVCVAGLLVFVLGFRPAATVQSEAPVGILPRGQAMIGVLIAGTIWGLYNAALSMIFGYGPTLLSERGRDLEAAAGITSIVLWLLCLSVPLGGILADRFGKRDLVLWLGLAGFALTLVVAAETDAVLPVFVVLGLVGGLSVGPIMSLPSDVLVAEERAKGMGIFFTIYYVWMALGPYLAGVLADVIGTAAAAFHFGALLLLLALGLGVLFQRMIAQASSART
ncbi:MAG: CynX/NimT family MFS transporter [Paracoccaceae bacterium]